ncbi:MAG: oligoribonuclease [Candidatus Babeliales bacterium]
MAENNKKLELLLWIDLEMTGLSIDSDVILEIASLITDGQLNSIAQGPHIVIHHDDAILARMDTWCTQQHTKSGLVREVRESVVSIEEAQEQTVAFVQQHSKKKDLILCGNSIWQDRLFIQKHMPQLATHLHYKMIDVTSVQQLIKRWYPNNPLIEFKKTDSHRALPDIKESLAELAHYRTNFFVPSL